MVQTFIPLIILWSQHFNMTNIAQTLSHFSIYAPNFHSLVTLRPQFLNMANLNQTLLDFSNNGMEGKKSRYRMVDACIACRGYIFYTQMSW